MPAHDRRAGSHRSYGGREVIYAFFAGIIVGIVLTVGYAMAQARF